jgi:hypothetical protein
MAHRRRRQGKVASPSLVASQVKQGNLEDSPVKQGSQVGSQGSHQVGKRHPTVSRHVARLNLMGALSPASSSLPTAASSSLLTGN